MTDIFLGIKYNLPSSAVFNKAPTNKKEKKKKKNHTPWILIKARNNRRY